MYYYCALMTIEEILGHRSLGKKMRTSVPQEPNFGLTEAKLPQYWRFN